MATGKETLDTESKKTLRRQTWRERIIASGQKDPMICPHCKNFYEYMGEVYPKDGKLEIKVALTTEARNYMERVINDLESIKLEPQKRKKKKGTDHLRLKKTFVNYHCLECREEEHIPIDIVREFDLMDGGDPTTPPRFSCEQCGGEMYPEYYKGIHGQEYKLSDIR